MIPFNAGITEIQVCGLLVQLSVEKTTDFDGYMEPELATLQQMTARLSGGALSIALNKSDIYKATVQALEDLGVENSLMQLPTVVFYDDVLKGFTQREKEAIFFHEVAHLLFGHSDIAVKREGCYIDSVLLEIEADAFAVTMGYGREMAMVIAKLATGKHEPKREEIIASLTANETFGARAMALQEQFEKASQ